MKPKTINLESLSKRYLNGELLMDLAKEVGIHKMTLGRKFKKLGIAPWKQKHFDQELFAKRYLTGEPLYKLCKEIGIDRFTLTNRFKKMGIPLRSRSEISNLVYKNSGESYKQAITLRARTSRRGKKASRKEQFNRAKAIEKLGEKYGNVSEAEKIIVKKLISKGVSAIHQFAVWKYNIDILAGDSLAIEIYGGMWHEVKSHKNRNLYIMDHGFDRLDIWVDYRRHLFDPVKCADSIISFINFRKQNPLENKFHTAIWGDGSPYIPIPQSS